MAARAFPYNLEQDVEGTVPAPIPMPNAAEPVLVRTPQEAVEDYVSLRDMIKDLNGEKSDLHDFLVDSVLKPEEGENLSRRIGNRTVKYTWSYPKDEKAFKVDQLVEFLQARGLTEALAWKATVDPEKVQQLVADGRLSPQELAVFVNKPTGRLNVD